MQSCEMHGERCSQVMREYKYLITMRNCYEVVTIVVIIQYLYYYYISLFVFLQFKYVRY